MANQYTIEQFGQQVKAKYPQYQNMSDVEIGQAVLNKYPQYQSSITSAQTTQPQEKKPGLLQNIFKPIGRTIATGLAAGEGAIDLARGDVKGAQEALTRERKTGFGVYRPIGLTDTGAEKSFGGQIKDVIGTGAGVASFLTPSAVGGTGIKALGRAGALAGGLGSGGEALQQDKSFGQVTGSTLGGAALGLGLGAGAGAVGKGLGSLGKGLGKVATPASQQAKGQVKNLPSRLINSLIKPPNKAFMFGKNPGGTVARLGIIGNTEEELAQGIIKNRQQIGEEIGGIVAPLTKQTISTQKVLEPLESAIKTAKKFERTNAPLINRLEGLRDDLSAIVANEKKISPQQAFELKQEIGRMSKWTGQAFDSELNQARVGVYQNLKKQIEMAATGKKSATGRSLKELNDLYGNLVEADSAIQSRMAQSQRFNMLSLPGIGAAGVGALAFGTPGAAAAYALREALGSVAFRTRAASALSKMLSQSDDATKKAIDDVLPKIAPQLKDMSEVEVNKIIFALPILVKALQPNLAEPEIALPETSRIR